MDDRRVTIVSRWPLIGLALMGVVTVGCAEVGKVQMVPLLRSDLAPGEALVGEVRVAEAWHWLGDDGTLNIALRYHRAAPVNDVMDFEWLMSIVLEGPPAGSGRLYKADHSTIRMTSSGGGAHARARSASGVVVIEPTGSGKFTGRFHVWARKQQFTVLGGWTPEMNRAPMHLLLGEFESTENVTKGTVILAETEADGMDRSDDANRGPRIRWLTPSPTSRPATMPHDPDTDTQ